MALSLWMDGKPHTTPTSAGHLVTAHSRWFSLTRVLRRGSNSQGRTHRFHSLDPILASVKLNLSGILRGTHQRALAEKFVDFMLSKQFQEDMPLQMYVYPVNKNAVLPESFTLYAQIPSQPAALTPDEIAVNRDKWIQEWIATVLK